MSTPSSGDIRSSEGRPIGLSLLSLLPAHLPLHWAIAGAFGLFLLQLASGTDSLFAELIFIFSIGAVVAINWLGGLRTLSGLCVALMALKVVILSQWIKVLLWEPASGNLESPTTTAGVVAAGIWSVAGAAWFGTRWQIARPLLPVRCDLSYLKHLALLALVLGTVGNMFMLGSATGDGQVQIGGIAGIFKRIRPCGEVAVIAGTAYTLLASQGKRCLSWLNGTPMVLLFVVGLWGTSKEGMLIPFLCFLCAAAAFRMRLRRGHVLMTIALTLLVQFFIFPYSQVGRNRIQGLTFGKTWQEIAAFAEEFFTTRKGWEELHEQENDAEKENRFNYFTRSSGLLERLALIKPADALITATLSGEGFSGWSTVQPSLQAFMPASVFRRPYVNVANVLGTKAGMISDEDAVTSVSFGFIADSFSAFGWTGVLVMPFLLCLLFFTINRMLLGPLEGNIWCVFFITAYQHTFAEISFSALFARMTYDNLWLLFVVMVLHFGAKLLVALQHQLTHRSPSDTHVSVVARP